MAAVSRQPLTSRALPLQLPAVISPLKTITATTTKRARSPETQPDPPSKDALSKRVKVSGTSSAAAPREEERKEKERKRAERDTQKREFRVKYTKAFPSWTFYFDVDQLDPEETNTMEVLEGGVSQFGGKIEDFFSNQITHLITNKPIPSNSDSSNKENQRRGRSQQIKVPFSLKSPVKLKGRSGEDFAALSSAYDIVQKAMDFGMKIWSTAKLQSVLERCFPPADGISSQPLSTLDAGSQPLHRPRSLGRLLESERLHGATCERDPAQKRHDYHYFSRSSYFLLVEDLQEELAPIAIMEYPITRTKDGEGRGAWPILHCHPLARGPFIEFNEREQRRYEKSLLRTEAEKKKENEAREVARLLRDEGDIPIHQKKGTDLRRSVSMSNLRRQISQADEDGIVDLDQENRDVQGSTNASGYLASTGNTTYVAASGNSVGITSTTGTTSTGGGARRKLQLPSGLRERLQQQIVTSRKVSITTSNKGSQKGAMGPPSTVPERMKMLRKSRSTNTMRLPRREEGTKPGYCECCREKFEDFKAHITGRKHRRFAEDGANFFNLDTVLARVQRRTLAQAQVETREWEARCQDRQQHAFDLHDGAVFPLSLQDEDQTMQCCDDDWYQDGVEEF